MLRSRRFFLGSLVAMAAVLAGGSIAQAGAGEGKLRANLTGTADARGATGRADYRPARTEVEKGKKKTKPAEIKVEVQKLGLPVGTALDVILDPAQGPDVKLGTLRVNKGGVAKFESTTTAIAAAGDVVKVVTQGAAPKVLLSGAFRPHQ